MYTIDLTEIKEITVGATGTASVIQQIRTLLHTRKGSVPLDRDFGLSWDFVDAPLPRARQLLISEIVEQLKKYVPQATFYGVSFDTGTTAQAQEGIMPVSVTVDITE